MLKLTTNNRRLLLLGTFVTSLFLFFQPSLVAAQQGLTLAPLREEMTIAPGTTQKRTMGVLNSTEQPMTVQLSSEVFSVINPDYNYSFTEESEVARWVRFAETEIQLEAGESRSIAYEVAVPIGTEPGGAYISIFATNDTQQETSAITLKQRLGLLLYITVDGEVTRNGSLLSLSAPWIVGAEGRWSATLQNTGTAHFRSRFEVVIKDVFGGTVSSTTGESLVLPGTIRRVSEVLNVPFWPGVYTATYSIGLGDQPAYTESKRLLVVPLWLWLILGTLAAVGTLTMIVRRSKKNS